MSGLNQNSTKSTFGLSFQKKGASIAFGDSAYTFHSGKNKVGLKS